MGKFCVGWPAVKMSATTALTTALNTFWAKKYGTATSITLQVPQQQASLNKDQVHVQVDASQQWQVTSSLLDKKIVKNSNDVIGNYEFNSNFIKA